MANYQQLRHFYEEGSRLVLITIGQGVNMGVVEQALVALAPRETLLTATQIFVLNELLAGVIVLLLVLQVCVQHAQTDSWHGHEERQTLPDLVATCKRSVIRANGFNDF